MAFLDRHRSWLLGDPLTSSSGADRYSKAYFDKWYRNPRYRVKSRAELERQVRFVLAMAEWVLGRPVRTVLDVGCGEGNWLPVLARLRPRIAYEGIDPSEYAVGRFGRRRNIQLGGIEDVAALARRRSYDLVVCCGMLNYLEETQLRAGLAQVADRTGGLAYLELFTSDDLFEGDTAWPDPKPARWYRREMQKVGLLPVGMQGYVHRNHAGLVAALERP